ncbi:hypothetical protein DL98DRAFT_221114 [Cadophora sp. DSE1049]|nr:hypothetical protein DL98DRAFT_221114 [Cadophora sp. DSE1049]
MRLGCDTPPLLFLFLKLGHQPADPSSPNINPINTTLYSQFPTPPMNPPTVRIRKRRAPQQRPPLDPRQTPSVLQRRSSRIQLRQHPHILGSHYESQSALGQRLTNTQPSQPVEATSSTRVPTSNPVDVSAVIPSITQLQEYPSTSQTHNHQTRKRRPDRSVETSAERPPKRARLTAKNLKAFQKWEEEQDITQSRIRHDPNQIHLVPELRQNPQPQLGPQARQYLRQILASRVLPLRMVSLIQPTPHPLEILITYRIGSCI